MIQVCSLCGTRWNVRDRERIWCPRCHGTLLAPGAAAPVTPPTGRPLGTPAPQPVAQPVSRARGFRWIAVRPGPPPPPRHQRRPLGPTPRYQTIPRWGLVDQIAAPAPEHTPLSKYTSASTVRIVLLVAGGVLFLAAAAHALRYLLLLINRTTLLPPFIAIGSLITGIFVSLAALVAVAAVAVTLTSWLIGRRAEAFARHGQDDPRPSWTLWVGCLVPPVNFFFAPLFVLELAQAERCRERQNAPVLMWAIAWMVAALICGWATWTDLRAVEPQAVADNTVTMVIAYLAGLAVLVLVWRVLTGFIGSATIAARPTHRWVVVGSDAVAPSPDLAETEERAETDEERAEADEERAEADEERAEADEESSAIESRDREPAA